jgi:hypothetical protein
MRKLLLFTFTVLLPAVIVGISNFTVFPDSAWAATLMLALTIGVSAVFTWQSGNATPKISRYCICADFVIAAILCLNLAGHWILAREVSAARQGVEETHTEEDREEKRRTAETERQLKLKKADMDLQNAEARRLGRLPRSERRSAIQALKAAIIVEPTATPIEQGSARRITPKEVRDSWWWKLTALAIAEVFASVLAGAILFGIWEWDRNHDSIPDHLQKPIEVNWPNQVGK